MPTAPWQTSKALEERAAEEPWREGRRGGWRDSALSLSPTQSTGEGPSLVKATLGLFLKTQLHGITAVVCGQTQQPLVPSDTLCDAGSTQVCLTQCSFFLLREASDFYFLIIFLKFQSKEKYIKSCRREHLLPAPVLLLDLFRIAVPGVGNPSALFPIPPPSTGFPEEHVHPIAMLWGHISKWIKLSRGMEGQKSALLTSGPLLPGLPMIPGWPCRTRMRMRRQNSLSQSPSWQSPWHQDLVPMTTGMRGWEKSPLMASRSCPKQPQGWEAGKCPHGLSCPCPHASTLSPAKYRCRMGTCVPGFPSAPSAPGTPREPCKESFVSG